MTSSDERNDQGVAPPGEPKPGGRRRFRRTRALGHWVVESPRHLAVFLVVLAGVGALLTIGGMASTKWTETRGFCSRCHTMDAEVKANKQSAHRDVGCAECHVSPGLRGFVKAKVNGLKQLFQVLTDSYPKPIGRPDHTLLPPPKDTCMKCHSLANITEEGQPTKVDFRPRYRKNRSNTRELIALVVRPGGLGKEGPTRGAHWHVDQRVDFTSRGRQAQKIDWVGVTFKDGGKKEYIARKKVTVSSDVSRDVAELQRTEPTRRMDCIDCHNRVGHPIPSPDRAVDDAIAAGEISRYLPYIKRKGVSLISARYPSTKAADQAIAGLRKTYAARYPLVLKRRRPAVNKAVKELQEIYRSVATPDMRVTAKTYPSNLGHQTSAGCFRCHDGAHYQVVKGRVLNKTIPSKCSTCHTFPQVGSKITSLPLTDQPNFHGPRAKILFNHRKLIAQVGRKTCATCHQPASCARCHKDSVLGSTKPRGHDSGRAQASPALLSRIEALLGP